MSFWQLWNPYQNKKNGSQTGSIIKKKTKKQKQAFDGNYISTSLKKPMCLCWNTSCFTQRCEKLEKCVCATFIILTAIKRRLHAAIPHREREHRTPLALWFSQSHITSDHLLIKALLTDHFLSLKEAIML